VWFGHRSRPAVHGPPSLDEGLRSMNPMEAPEYSRIRQAIKDTQISALWLYLFTGRPSCSELWLYPAIFEELLFTRTRLPHERLDCECLGYTCVPCRVSISTCTLLRTATGGASSRALRYIVFPNRPFRSNVARQCQIHHAFGSWAGAAH
jgi:hypothetical protein